MAQAVLFAPDVPAARAAMDMALLDLRAHAGVPLYWLLGPARTRLLTGARRWGSDDLAASLIGPALCGGGVRISRSAGED